MAAVIDLPPTLPAACIMRSAEDYAEPPELLLAIIKVESNGKATSHVNTDGSVDYGISMINSSSWLPRLAAQYGIDAKALVNNPCQSIRAMAYIVRVEVNDCGGNLWCGVGHYHSRTPVRISHYVRRVWNAYVGMIETGQF
jgi:hypothetical protein